MIDLEGLTNDKTIYDEIHELVSNYDTEQIAARYIENLQEVKRKFKIESELTKANSTIAALVEGKIAYKNSPFPLSLQMAPKRQMKSFLSQGWKDILLRYLGPTKFFRVKLDAIAYFKIQNRSFP